ncbi:type VI secretion system tube protein TssD [uncultured Flavobacterium sp.]|uniref:type VI secretion system tube protein TssD n=1 Tax=uncultured Flavobacterium sp. TaxID=165435 RepID=UPI00292CCB3F|nr:type VI secretion system tube protein TssD [uncultured Flavobacterium sp.]
MTSAKLFILGEERELLSIDTNYYRYTRYDGSPTSNIEGGLITLSFVSEESDEVFWYNMIKKVDKRTDRMEKGEVHFYSKGEEDIPIRKYKFNDAYLIELSEVFYSDGTENMRTILTISPAIQNYGTPHDLVKHWQKSWIPPAQPIYYLPAEEKKETQVKIIQLTISLDFGSANDGSGTNQQQGMLFGKTYEFKVIDYTQETPTDLSVINWMYKYHSLSQNKWIENKLSVTGDTLKFTLNEKDMCGRFVYLRAYIKDVENEGELKVWKHNRFRWFDRMIVHNQINSRVKDPWKIDQGYSSLCGMAALYYAMIKRDSKAYEKLAKELFRTGEHTIGSYIIKPHDKALGMYETKITDLNYIAMDMSAIDWIVLATTRSKESLNSQFVYNGFENGDVDMLKAVNWPEMLTRMCKEVAGFTHAEAIDLGLLQIANKKGISGKLNDALGDIDIMHLKIIDRKYKQGHTILMMIDSGMIEDKVSYNVKDLTENAHWVVYEGGLNFIDIGDSKFVGFRIYTWGYDPVNQIDESGLPAKSTKTLIYKNERISIESFKSNYYGYIEMF